MIYSVLGWSYAILGATFVATLVFCFGFTQGYRIGIKHTEERWSEAVGRKVG